MKCGLIFSPSLFIALTYSMHKRLLGSESIALVAETLMPYFSASKAVAYVSAAA